MGCAKLCEKPIGKGLKHFSGVGKKVEKCVKSEMYRICVQLKLNVLVLRFGMLRNVKINLKKFELYIVVHSFLKFYRSVQNTKTIKSGGIEDKKNI